VKKTYNVIFLSYVPLEITICSIIPKQDKDPMLNTPCTHSTI